MAGAVERPRDESGEVLVRLKVVPGASRDEIVGPHGDRIRVRVAAPPEGGKANEAVLELLAERLGVAASALRLVRGAASPLKTVAVKGVPGDDVERMLQRKPRTSSGRIAFLLSGAGSTLENLLHAIDRGEVPGEVVVALSDRRDAKGLDHARTRGIPVGVVERRAYPGAGPFSKALEEALRPHAPDVVVLGGFLSLFRVPPDLAGRILNVHPSLLPKYGGKGFYGERVHEAVLEAGEKVSGCTVHVVTDEVDGGPIVEQATVKVEAGDTPHSLAERVQEAERRLYPKCIRAFLEGRVRVEGGRLRRS